LSGIRRSNLHFAASFRGLFRSQAAILRFRNLLNCSVFDHLRRSLQARVQRLFSLFI
jgi:hypothetical protein